MTSITTTSTNNDTDNGLIVGGQADPQTAKNIGGQLTPLFTACNFGGLSLEADNDVELAGKAFNVVNSVEKLGISALAVMVRMILIDNKSITAGTISEALNLVCPETGKRYTTKTKTIKGMGERLKRVSAYINNFPTAISGHFLVNIIKDELAINNTDPVAIANKVTALLAEDGLTWKSDKKVFDHKEVLTAEQLATRAAEEKAEEEAANKAKADKEEADKAKAATEQAESDDLHLEQLATIAALEVGEKMKTTLSLILELAKDTSKLNKSDAIARLAQIAQLADIQSELPADSE